MCAHVHMTADCPTPTSLAVTMRTGSVPERREDRALPVPSFPGLNVQRVGDESPPQHVDKTGTDHGTYSPGLLRVGETPEIARRLGVLVHRPTQTASSKEP